MPKLNEERERVFVDEYCKDLCGGRAMLRVNPELKAWSADEMAARLLKRRRVAVDVFRRIAAEDPSARRDGLQRLARAWSILLSADPWIATRLPKDLV
jgi:hypothetical protein